MKHLLILLLVLGMLIPVYGQNPLIPKYYIQKDPSGEIRIYKPSQLVVPKYIVKPTPDGYEVFEPGHLVIPKYRIQEPLNEGKPK